MFDLESSIASWRKALAAQPEIRGSDLDELEDHLREEIATLKGRGLAEDESFLVAARRLGAPEDLGGEFAIADPGRRRKFRLSWMITGALALVFLYLVSEVLMNFGTGILVRLPGGPAVLHGPTRIGLFAGVIKLATLVVGGILVWRLLATDRSSRRLSRLNAAAIVGLALGVAFLALAARTGSMVFMSSIPESAGPMVVAVSNAWINWALLLLLPAVLLVGLWRLIRT